jgi:hypothetical protein
VQLWRLNLGWLDELASFYRGAAGCLWLQGWDVLHNPEECVCQRLHLSLADLNRPSILVQAAFLAGTAAQVSLHVLLLKCCCISRGATHTVDSPTLER